MKPIVNSWAIASHGQQVTYKGKTVLSKNTICFVDCDMRAKAPLQNIKQAPAYDACDYCEIHGFAVLFDSKKVIRYLAKSIFEFDTYKVRTEQRWLNCINHVAQNDVTDCIGIKGPSVMQRLPYWKMVDCFVKQPLHLLWEK